MCQMLDINSKLKEAKESNAEKLKRINEAIIRGKSAQLLEASADSIFKGYSVKAVIKVIRDVATDLERLIEEG